MGTLLLFVYVICRLVYEKYQQDKAQQYVKQREAFRRSILQDIQDKRKEEQK